MPVKRPAKPNPQGPLPALFVALGALIILLAGGSRAAWARPGAEPGHQTVPTMPPTGAPQPTSTPEAAQPAPDLQAAFRASVQAVLPGQQFQYQIEIVNAGAAPVGPLVVRLPLPEGLELLGTRASAGRVETAGQIVAARVETLPAGATWQLEIDVRVRADAPAGAVIEARFTLERGGQTWSSPAVAVSLPPAELPRTGGE